MPPTTKVRRLVQGDFSFSLSLSSDGNDLQGHIFDQELKVDLLGSYDGSAGLPILELSVLSAQVIPQASRPSAGGSQSSQDIALLPMPCCKLEWSNTLVDILPAVRVDEQYTVHWNNNSNNSSNNGKYQLALPEDYSSTGSADSSSGLSLTLSL